MFNPDSYQTTTHAILTSRTISTHVANIFFDHWVMLRSSITYTHGQSSAARNLVFQYNPRNSWRQTSINCSLPSTSQTAYGAIQRNFPHLHLPLKYITPGKLEHFCARANMCETCRRFDPQTQSRSDLSFVDSPLVQN